MLKKNLICILTNASLMIVLPLCTVRFIRNDAAMAVCLILFFAVNPIAAIMTGIFTGKNIYSRWFQPLLLPVLFITGVWIAFEMGEKDFLIYAAIYLILGYLSAIITVFINKKNQRY
ncbi:MAG: hypothetical protein IIZ64_03595 [Erysipelotrichaceae bacterium]|nr:hypothetical protein [Erysipelotrichaceae bacterium]